jgi:hypothetical protein
LNGVTKPKLQQKTKSYHVMTYQWLVECEEQSRNWNWSKTDREQQSQSLLLLLLLLVFLCAQAFFWI